MSKYNARILVCCHKKDIMEVNYPYMPIQLGKALTTIDLGITKDDTGENISHKNKSYCELTGIYWAWKNLQNSEIIGICHYRRYFDFHNICNRFKPYTIFPTSYFNTTDFSIPDYILSEVLSGAIVLPRQENFPITASAQFNESHSSLDLSIIKNIIKEEYIDKYSKAIWKTLTTNNKISLSNMFIMNKDNFNNYCNWIFSILSKAESMIDIRNYPDYQKRLFGFIAERLLNVWVYAEEKKVMRYPIIYFSDYEDRLSSIPIWKYGLGCAINNVINLLRQIEYKLSLTP